MKMSFNYQFSVGTIAVGSNDLGIVTDIGVTYDGDPQSFYGGDYRLPLAVELGNRSGEITCTTARFSITDDVLDNNYVDVVLGTGHNSGGLSGTINNCKVTSYNVTSNQNQFVTSDMNLAITSQDAEEATKGGEWPAWI
jgi:hypothetical protein